MPNADDAQLIREATSIFLRLRDAPDDPELIREKDDFLDRGPAERLAYTKMLSVWKATDTERRSRQTRAPLFLVAAVVLLGGYWSAGSVRIWALADLSTRFETDMTQLASGDMVTMDAASAIVDDTDTHKELRQVALLQGAAFFDVQKDGRPFSVTLGEIEVNVVGTSFEVNRFNDGAAVSVSKGAVRVSISDQSWDLVPSDQLLWSPETGVSVVQTDASEVAQWRDDLLVADGLSLGRIVDILDRRVSGDIVVTSAVLSNTPIVGTFDLSDPEAALRSLAQLEGARLWSIPNVITIVRPRSVR